MKDELDCGAKHNRLLGLIVVIVLAVCTATIGYCQVTLSEIEARVRLVEQSSAANAVRFEMIQASLRRMEQQAALTGGQAGK